MNWPLSHRGHLFTLQTRDHRRQLQILGLARLRLRIAAPRTRDVPVIALLTLGSRVLRSPPPVPLPDDRIRRLDVLIPRVRGIEGEVVRLEETRETGIRGVH